jgi:hypothetical protein
MITFNPDFAVVSLDQAPLGALVIFGRSSFRRKQSFRRCRKNIRAISEGVEPIRIPLF